MPSPVSPKKFLGQHFLRDENIARKIVESLTGFGNYDAVLEVGPGTGVLTKFLALNEQWKWYGAELDRDSAAYLREEYPRLLPRIIEGDFLKMDLNEWMGKAPFAVIGNFPYNISSQILFKVLENRDQIPEMVGMFQKEVALRIASKPGNKVYGILSVLTQAFYDVEMLFNVDPQVFHPPPKVQSAVIRLKRKTAGSPDCDPALFFRVVKTAFNQRRKMLSNSLKNMNVKWEILPEKLSYKRPEQLGVEEFVKITKSLQEDKMND